MNEKKKEKITCQECDVDFEIKYSEEYTIEFCPMCATELYLEDETEEDSEDKYELEWNYPDNDEYE